MKTSIYSEKDVELYKDKLPEGLIMIYFKLVGVGENTLSKNEHLGYNVCNIVRDVPGFFLMSQDGIGLRDAMHDLVDRFCNIQEGRDESKN